MLSKFSWVPFVPFTAGAVFFKLAQEILPDGAIFGLSDMMLDYAVIACVAVIFLFALIFCMADRRISPYYLQHRNVPAGLLGLLLALVLAADGANRTYNLFGGGQMDVFEIIEAALLLLSAIVFVVMGLTHSFRGSKTKGMPILSVVPAFLFAVRLVRCFIGFTTISITQADVVLLITYVFATMFFFNYAVALSLTQAKNAVKSCFIFGFPAVAAALAWGVFEAVYHVDTVELFENAQMVELLLMGLYIFAFLLEMTVFIKDRDHIVIEGVDDQEEYKDVDADKEDLTADDYVVTGVEDEDRMDVPASSYISTADTSDFLYVDTSSSKKAKKEKNQPELTYEQDDDDYITQVVESEYDKKDKTPSTSYSDRLDEIDKLILEISGDSE